VDKNKNSKYKTTVRKKEKIMRKKKSKLTGGN
jgi:hypothetical protein